MQSFNTLARHRLPTSPVMAQPLAESATPSAEVRPVIQGRRRARLCCSGKAQHANLRSSASCVRSTPPGSARCARHADSQPHHSCSLLRLGCGGFCAASKHAVACAARSSALRSAGAHTRLTAARSAQFARAALASIQSNDGLLFLTGASGGETSDDAMRARAPGPLPELRFTARRRVPPS